MARPAGPICGASDPAARAIRPSGGAIRSTPSRRSTAGSTVSTAIRSTAIRRARRSTAGRSTRSARRDPDIRSRSGHPAIRRSGGPNRDPLDAIRLDARSTAIRPTEQKTAGPLGPPSPAPPSLNRPPGGHDRAQPNRVEIITAPHSTAVRPLNRTPLLIMAHASLTHVLFLSLMQPSRPSRPA
jgi:hypothetical protein